MVGVPTYYIPLPPTKTPPPYPRIPPLYDTLSGGKRGVNPLNLDKSFLFEKSPLYVDKIFWEKFEKTEVDPHILKINFLEKF
jgi:hypothetical protein